jgi:hypothetical protein
MLVSLNYSFRNPKNIIWVIYRIKELRNYKKKKKKHGVLRGPQFDKQRWRARLGILRVKLSGEKGDLELALNKTSVLILILIKKDILQIRTFYDCYGQEQYLRYTCPCQIPAHEITDDTEAQFYFLRSMIFKGPNLLLTRLMD